MALRRSVLIAWSVITVLASAELVAQTTSQGAAGEGCAPLAEAEALHSGAGGSYDPDAARPLFEQAAAAGCPEAVFRIALLRHMGSTPWQRDRAGAASQLVPVNEVVETKATAGDGYCQYLIGTAWLVGMGRSVNYLRAREWLEKAATVGQDWALLNLGWMASVGHGLAAPDSAAAMAAYCRAAQMGNVSAMVSCANLLAQPRAKPARCQRALGWYRKAQQAGSASAAKWLAQLLYYGREGCLEPDPAEALPWLKRAAADQSPDALYNLAFALLTGDGGQQDEARAVELLSQAAPNLTLAAELLFFLNETGIAVERDPAQADHWRDMAAVLGSDGLQRWLRETTITPRALALHEKGLARLESRVAQGDAAAGALLARRLFASGQQSDAKRAVGLLRGAAEAGSLDAMRLLGSSLIHGDQFAQDAKGGLAWWRRCARGGNGFCMMHLGNALMQGELVRRDMEEGRSWLERAGETGNWWAISDLGHFYDEGWNGSARNPERAAIFKRLLAARGDAESKGWLKYHGYSLE